MTKRSLIKEPFSGVGNYHRYLLGKKQRERLDAECESTNEGCIGQKATEASLMAVHAPRGHFVPTLDPTAPPLGAVPSPCKSSSCFGQTKSLRSTESCLIKGIAAATSTPLMGLRLVSPGPGAPDPPRPSCGRVFQGTCQSKPGCGEGPSSSFRMSFAQPAAGSPACDQQTCPSELSTRSIR
jgi:hypothetical protein